MAASIKDIVNSCLSLANNNDGLFKSERQAKCLIIARQVRVNFYVKINLYSINYLSFLLCDLIINSSNQINKEGIYYGITAMLVLVSLDCFCYGLPHDKTKSKRERFWTV